VVRGAGVTQQEKREGRDAVVVTVFCYDNKKYLSTALANEEPVKPEYKTPEIELLSVGTVGRACEFCH
jgi:cysteine synthase